MRRSGFTFIPLLFIAAESLAVRAIPDDNLAYPVLIALRPRGTGSGFFLNTTDGSYLVTARHVLFSPSGSLIAEQVELTAYPRDPKDMARNVFLLDMKALAAAGYVKRHPTRDVAVVKVATVASSAEPKTLQPLAGVTLSAVAPSGILGVGLEAITKYDDVLVANDVFLFGYPSSLGLKAIPQLDVSRPLLRRGIVAGLNPALRSIVLDCPVYPGNSGGPVLEVEQDGLSRRFRVIGVVSEFVPFVETWVNATHGYENSSIANSSYSIATPMDYVLELLP